MLISITMQQHSNWESENYGDCSSSDLRAQNWDRLLLKYSFYLRLIVSVSPLNQTGNLS